MTRKYARGNMKKNTGANIRAMLVIELALTVRNRINIAFQNASIGLQLIEALVKRSIITKLIRTTRKFH